MFNFKKKIFFCLIGFFAVIFLFTNKADAQESIDGIAVRVMPNPQSLSPTRWYQENVQNQGSPSQLIVDGYQAVRDGRSVYVSAANIESGAPGIDDDKLYINIYILSYTQPIEEEADENNATTDIFGQLLNNWTFNINILNSSNYGDCQKIENNSKTGRSCFVDIHCNYKNGEYCASEKASIVRDVKRLADMRDIELYLNNYYEAVGLYPKLDAGTYLPKKSISSWPSWQETLGMDLGITLPVDPLNKLSGCPAGFDPQTCWNENTQAFAGTLPENPMGSVYQYISENEGKNYQLCAVMETNYTSDFNGACRATNWSGPGVSTDSVENRAPIILVKENIALNIREPLREYITAYDPDGVIKKWEITGAGFSLENTGSFNERILKHDSWSSDETVQATIKVTDNQGSTSKKTINITIK